MIKKLQQKIVLIITLLLAIAVVVLMFAINFMSQAQNEQQVRQTLNRLADKDGRVVGRGFDPFHDDDDIYVDSFAIKIGTEGSVEIVLNQNILVDGDEMADYADQALQSGKDMGYIGNYAYLIKEKSYGMIIVFLDASFTMQQNENLIITTSIIGCAAVLVFFGIAVALSFWLVRPVRETFDKQKLFISNASHELKTPLAVISANADVLESEIGENKWLSYIKSDALRMSELVNELLALARLDDKSGHKLIRSEFNLTDIVLQTALPFESQMFEMGKKYDVDTEPDIMYNGDASAIKHIITILIDNAIKYSDEKGEIGVKLYTRSNKKIIEVYNTGNGIPGDKLDKVFERFYREDEARNSKSGGYGLGLSIAKETVKRHGGTISAQSEYGKWALFTVTL